MSISLRPQRSCPTVVHERAAAELCGAVATRRLSIRRSEDTTPKLRFPNLGAGLVNALVNYAGLRKADPFRVMGSTPTSPLASCWIRIACGS